MQCQLGTNLTWMDLQREMSSLRKDRNWKKISVLCSQGFMLQAWYEI